MPSSCAADSCANRQGACGYRFFRFPRSDTERCKLWVKSVCGRRAVDWWPAEGMRICGAHFLNEEPSENPKDVDYIPTIVGYKKGSLEKAVSADKRSKRYQQRCQKASVATTAASSPMVDDDVEEPTEFVDAPEEEVDTMESLRKRVAELTARNSVLEMQVSDLTVKLEESKQPGHFSVEDLKSSDKLTRFYTGLPNYSTFMSFFEYLEPAASRMHVWRGEKAELKRAASGVVGRSHHMDRKLSLIDEFLAVLMRLRLGLLVEDVCQRFGISASYYCKLFTTWVVFLAKELVQMFPWPSAEKVKLHTPPEFARYPNTRVIIDCFEVFLERPSSLKANCQAFSHYKNHATFKALIGISPGGVVTFLSPLYTGRASDKFIVKQCGLVDLLEPHDNVMADRGFDIHDLLLPKHVTLNIPPFLGQGRTQFTAKEVDDTRSIASLRIHVERAIARVKSFHILQGILPITLTPVANQVVQVCTYLTNFSDPLLPEKSIL